jgi:hypothetical protein
MKKSSLTLVLLTLFAAPALADNIGNMQEESRAMAMPFMKQLAAANQKAIAEGGPESAIKVCKEIAPAMAGEASRKNGVRMTRVSLKVRNPLLGTADAWEQKVLQDFEARLAKGEKPDNMEFVEVVNEPAGKSFRYMKAIALQPGCVACHGTADQISANVRTRLNEDYPNDQAIGYTAGQIRGAVSIKRAL